MYRVFYRILPTNIHLKKYKIKTCNRCSFCQKEEETYLHLFVECSVVTKCWTDVLTWLKDVTGVSIKFRNHELILGLSTEFDHHISYMDMIILFFKYYIYRCKCEQILPNIESFIKQFLYVKETEKTIAVGKCKERIFKDKWKELVDA